MKFCGVDEGTQFKIYDRVMGRLHEVEGAGKPMELLMDMIDKETQIAISETEGAVEYYEIVYGPQSIECPNCGYAV